MMSPVFIARLRWGTYLFFAVLSYSFVFIVWKFYPETSNYTLEDIDSLFYKGGDENLPDSVADTKAAHPHSGMVRDQSPDTLTERDTTTTRKDGEKDGHVESV